MTALLYLALCRPAGSGGIRLHVEGLIRSVTPGRFPTATALINPSGSFPLGLASGLTLSQGVPDAWRFVLDSGFLGGYTTFSTASLESVRLAQEGRISAGLLNGIGVLITEIAAAAIGDVIGLNL